MNDVSLAIELLGYADNNLSLQQAKNVLNLITNDGQQKVSSELLKDLVNRVLADAPGNLTVLYGGTIQGEGAGNIVRNMALNDPNLRVIGNTPVADSLEGLKFWIRSIPDCKYYDLYKPTSELIDIYRGIVK